MNQVTRDCKLRRKEPKGNRNKKPQIGGIKGQRKMNGQIMNNEWLCGKRVV